MIQSSNIREQPRHIKIVSVKKLWADWSKGKPTSIRYRICCFPLAPITSPSTWASL